MKIFDKISMCLRNLWRRKMRTFLTVFGVVIGTCAIVVMVSLGVGMDQAQQSMLEGMGNLTLINVYQGYNMVETGGGKPKEPPPLDEVAVAALKSVPHVKAVTAMHNIWSGELAFQVDGRYLYRGNVTGIDIEAMPALGYELESGRFPTKAEFKNSVIVGSEAAYQFVDSKRRRNNRVSAYPDEFGRIKDPFVNFLKDRLYLNIGKSESKNSNRMMVRSSRGRGEEVEIPTGNGSYPMKVAGVLKTSEDGNGVDRDFDTRNSIYMDVTRLKELVKEYNKKNKIRSSDENYNQVYVMADSIDTVDAVDEMIKSLGFDTWSASSMREDMQKQTQTIQMVLGGLAGISLLVAALGITNTMIMSIYERTREIGIMKVLGCAVGNIRSVFLMEAGCIGFLGGVLGIGISYVISFILNFVLNQASADGGGGGNMMGMMFGWQNEGVQYSIIPSWLVGGALLFAICIGLFSGFYPANRAVKISALEAIKHE